MRRPPGANRPSESLRIGIVVLLTGRDGHEAGTTGQGTSGGGWLNSLMGMFSGGGSSGSGEGGGWGPLIASFFGGGRANGGPVMGGKFYDVNERGVPELLSVGNRQMLMMPQGMNGRVTPMRSGSGGMNQIVTQNFYGRTSRQTADQAARESGRAAQRAIRRNG
jgi:hypothetical protein